MAIKKATKKAPAKRKVKASVEEKNISSYSSRMPTGETVIPKKYIIGGIILILLGIGIYLFKNYFIVATVNGQPITRLELMSELEKQAGKQTMQFLITRSIILQEAQKQNVIVSQKDVDAEVKKIEDTLSKQGQTLTDALSSRGITKDVFLEQVRIQTTMDKIVGKDIKISDKDVTDYIAANKASFPEETISEQTKATVKQRLLQQKLGEKEQAWLQNLQNKAKVEQNLKL